MCVTIEKKSADDDQDISTGDDKTISASKSATVSEIIVDMTLPRPANMHKLITKEDGHFGHVHKVIGTAALVHYGYRTYLLMTTGSMQFDDSNFTLACIVLHMVLSVSSFVFKIPNNRINSAPMIYPEFRLHSIIFAYRSLIVMLLMWSSRRWDMVFPLYFRGVVVLLTMAAADTVTNRYSADGYVALIYFSLCMQQTQGSCCCDSPGLSHLKDQCQLIDESDSLLCIERHLRHDMTRSYPRPHHSILSYPCQVQGPGNDHESDALP
jgi:hypothetical protein